jgi:hypothetical protein
MVSLRHGFFANVPLSSSKVRECFPGHSGWGVERCRIAEVVLSDPSSLAAEKGFRRHVDFCNDMTALWANEGNVGILGRIVHGVNHLSRRLTIPSRRNQSRRKSVVFR